MKYEKGNSGNPNGRPRGSLNKRNIELEQRITDLIEGEIDFVKKGLKELRTNDVRSYIKAIIDLLPYALHKKGTVQPEELPETPNEGEMPEWLQLVNKELGLHNEEPN